MRGEEAGRVFLHEGCHVAVAEMLGVRVKEIEVVGNGVAHTRYTDQVRGWTATCCMFAPMVICDLSPNDMHYGLRFGLVERGCVSASDDGALAEAELEGYHREWVSVMRFLLNNATAIVDRAASVAETLHVGINTPDQWAVSK